MKKVKVAQFGLDFNPKNENSLSVLNLNLPEGTEILSVSTSKQNSSDDYTLFFTFHAPADAYNDSTYPWRTYHFSIVLCRYTDFEINEHKYVGDIVINNGIKNTTYSVFYEIGATTKN